MKQYSTSGYDKITLAQGQLILIDKLSSIPVPQVIKNEMLVVVLVLDGHGTFTISGNILKTNKNDMLICLPNTIFEHFTHSRGFKYRCFALSTECVVRYTPVMDNMWDIMSLLKQQPIIPLTDQEMTGLSKYYDLMLTKQDLPPKIQDKVIEMLLKAFFYDIHHILNHVDNIAPYKFTQREQHFKHFVEMLGQSYPKKRLVSYYAEQLCITPKYLASVCKDITGKTPSQIIDEHVMKDIEYLMKHTAKSIKDISAELDFPSLSFFGQYMRAHFGMSPKEYRKSITSKK